MLKIEVFDPPLCCSTGVCGPQIDPDLARAAADFKWLSERGIEITRYNLSQEPNVFASHPIVKQELTTRGNACLPLILANGRILSAGFYPVRSDFEAALSHFGIELDECCEEEDCCETDCCSSDENESGCCG